MKKLKIYLDTSVLSYLQQEDTLNEMNITLELWDKIKMGKYNVNISDAVLLELYECPQPKQDFLLSQLENVNFTVLDVNEDIRELAIRYINEGIIPKKCFDDATHIATATYYNCDCIVSWNFKHIVRDKTIIGANGINKLMGYKDIIIISPQSMFEGDESDD